MDEKLHLLRLSELQDLYEEDKKRLLLFQQEYNNMKKRLERERLLEAFNLINCRAELEVELELAGNQIAVLIERKAQYDLLFV